MITTIHSAVAELTRLRACCGLINDVCARVVGSPEVAEAVDALCESNLATILVATYEQQRDNFTQRVEDFGFPRLGLLGVRGGHPAIGLGGALVRRLRWPQGSGPLGSSRILWWGDTSTHLHAILPIALALTSCGPHTILVPIRKGRPDDANLNGIRFLRYEARAGLRGLPLPWTPMWRDLVALRSRRVTARVIEAVDPDATDAGRRWLSTRWRQIVAWLLPHAIAHVHAVRQLLRAQRPMLVVFGYDSDYRGNLIARAASELGIRTVTVQHGVVARPDLYCTRSDAYLTFHQFWHPYITSLTGATTFVPVGSVEAMRSPAPTNGDGRGVLVASNPGIDRLAERHALIRDVCLGLVRRGIPVTWRPHPAERAQGAKLAADLRCAGVRVSLGGLPAADVVRHALVVAGTSSMSLMALAGGKPLVQLPATEPNVVQLPADGRTVVRAASFAEVAEQAADLVSHAQSLAPECEAMARAFLVADGAEAVRRASAEVVRYANG